ncbi:hypothetical protein DNH61_20705 [Paenibacillus sambharensis]|uniref:DUF4190 domain-containing protein n=1 Tax=Paenibacillus sambharensis TaxID=1803190 RepID=A0A2W1L4U1_9BACL|nr:hypothetical protein [Paenibacillus sambharensis]PZD93919.1 hypothetical protein DNH61_20705 [Paenibacillus sambharensis]
MPEQEREQELLKPEAVKNVNMNDVEMDRELGERTETAVVSPLGNTEASPGTQEEMAADFAVTPGMVAAPPLTARGADREPLQTDELQVMDTARSGARALGTFALVFAIAALFIWPLLLGLTAAVLGYMAYRQGSRALGVWSITIGLLAAAAYLVFIPIYYMII